MTEKITEKSLLPGQNICPKFRYLIFFGTRFTKYQVSQFMTEIVKIFLLGGCQREGSMQQQADPQAKTGTDRHPFLRKFKNCVFKIELAYQPLVVTDFIKGRVHEFLPGQVWMSPSQGSPVERAFFTQFHVLCDGPFLDGKTTAIPKSPYYIWKMCKILYYEK